jgi:hypothetical protein
VPRLAELVEVHRELRPQAAGNRQTDDHRPVAPFRLDTLEGRERGIELVRIGQGAEDLLRPGVETLLPLDVHAKKLVDVRLGGAAS